MIYILSWTSEQYKKNSFRVTTFKVEENSRTFQGLAQTFKDLGRKNGIQGLFKDFSRLCEPCEIGVYFYISNLAVGMSRIPNYAY